MIEVHENNQTVYHAGTGTYGNIAARHCFASNPNARLIALGDHDDIIDAVNQDEATTGVVPISSVGSWVPETSRALLMGKYEIVGELSLHIYMHLIGLKNASKGQVREIVAQAQAVEQCEKYVENNGWKKGEKPLTTAAAVESVLRLNDPRVASLGGIMLLDGREELEVLDRHVGDNKDATTRFLVIKKHNGKLYLSEQSDEPRKVSWAVSIANSVGELDYYLGPVREAGGNLSAILSKPDPEPNGDYVIGMDCIVKARQVEDVIEAARIGAHTLNVLGVYPLGQTYESE